MGYTSVRKWIHIEIRDKFNLNEKGWNGATIFNMVHPEKHTISGRTGTNRKE
jgi:hypothetical protein